MNCEDYLSIDFTEIDKVSGEIDLVNGRLDHLFSWCDFVMQCRLELKELSARFSSIEFMVEKFDVGNGYEIDEDFGLGVCWIGAVAAYEGYLHKLLLNSLEVNSLQSRIAEFCERKISENSSPMRDMKVATLHAIREWLTKRTIADPRKMAKNFDEIFCIKTQQPDDAFCERLLNVRNAFAHRGGGGYKLQKMDVVRMIEELNSFAISYTKSLIYEVNEMLGEDARPTSPR